MIVVETRTDTPAIIRILESMGFERTGQTEATYGGETSERIIWRGTTGKAPPVYWERGSRSALSE